MSKFTLLKLVLYIILSLALILVLIQFLSVNQSLVILHTYFGALEGESLGSLLVISFLIGGVLGYVAAFVPSLFDLFKIKRLKSQLKTQKNRLDELERQQSAMLAHADLPGE